MDPRHLLLIADYMTFDGTFKPLSRVGLEASASPLQQMSFESTLKFLKSAIVSGECKRLLVKCVLIYTKYFISFFEISGRLENLNSPSSRLMVGQPCRSGTGAFTCITDNHFLFKYASK